MLLSLAQSDRERECIRYAVFKTSGMSASKARCQYGFERMRERSTRVEEAVVEVQQIRETVDEIAKVRSKAQLVNCRVSSSDDDNSCDESQGALEHSSELPPSVLELCETTLVKSNFKWFELQEVLEAEGKQDYDGV